MIKSASEFAALRVSKNPDDQLRASTDEANLAVWMTVVEQYPELRSWVAQNKTIPIEILELLARDSDALVRSAVASKRKLSLALQHQLASDPDSSVRARVAYNSKTEISILLSLVSDSESFVREAAAKKLDKRSAK